MSNLILPLADGAMRLARVRGVPLASEALGRMEAATKTLVDADDQM